VPSETRALSGTSAASGGAASDKDARGAGHWRESAARLAGRVIFYGALLLVALSAVPYGSIEPWWANIFSACVYALGALWAVESLLTGGLRLRRMPWLLLLPSIALALLSLIQTIPLARDGQGAGGVTTALRTAISADPFETYDFALRLLALTLLGAILLRFTVSRRRLTAVVLTVVLVGTLSALFGLVRQALQTAEMGFVLPSLPRGIGYGQIISRNQFAFMMEMSLGLSLGLAASRAGRYATRLFYIALALPVCAALILANSRGGILTMLCQLLFLSALVAPTWFGRRRARVEHRGVDSVDSKARRVRSRAVSLAARAFVAVAIVSIVSVAVVWVGGERVVSNLSTVGEELGAQAQEETATRWNTRRVDIWRATWKMFKENPIAGVGFGGYWAAIPQYHDASGEYIPQQAHNDYLEILASGGVIGALIFVSFVLVFLRRALETLRSENTLRRAACAGALTALFGVAVHSLFDFGLHMTANAALFVALIVVVTARVEDEGTGDKRAHS